MTRPHGVRGQHAALQGIAWLTIAVACYAVMDTLTRLLGPVFGVALMMVARYAVHTLAMALWLFWRRATNVTVPHNHQWGSQAVRGMVLFASSGFAVLALQRMPVAEYTAVIMLTPVLVTLASWLVLKHAVSLWQLVWVVGGLLGALIVIRPGSGLFGGAAWLALGVVGCNLTFQTITNHRGAQEDAVTSNFHSGWISLLLSVAWLVLLPGGSATDPMGPWVQPKDLILLLVMGALATAAQLALITALARAPAATLMPFSYAQIAFAAFTGWLALGDLPDPWSWVGMSVIAACGAASAWVAARVTSSPNGNARAA